MKVPAFVLLVTIMGLLGAKAAYAAEPSNQVARLRVLFADLPEYLAAPPFVAGMKSPPRPVAGLPPAKPNLLAPGQKVVVTLAVAIDEAGEVAAARVFASDDPRCDSFAVEAVLKWTFSPAMGETGPIKCIAMMPLHFMGPATTPPAVQVHVSPPVYGIRGLSLHVPVWLRGDSLPAIKGTRVRVTRAVDDTGADLAVSPSEQPARYFRPSVGGGPSRPEPSDALSLLVTLQRPTPSATRLSTFEGYLELVMPDRDENATAHISPLRFGEPISIKALALAGVQITLLDKASAVEALAHPARHPVLQDILSLNPDFDSMPPGKSPLSVEALSETDVVLLVDDPDGRLVDCEFQTFRGSPLDYNPRGHAHFETSAGRRVSIYDLNAPLNEEIKLVCWLATTQATSRTPFALANIPLPPPPK